MAAEVVPTANKRTKRIQLKKDQNKSLDLHHSHLKNKRRKKITKKSLNQDRSLLKSSNYSQPSFNHNMRIINMLNLQLMNLNSKLCNYSLCLKNLMN